MLQISVITPQRAAIPAALTGLVLPVIVRGSAQWTTAALTIYVCCALAYFAVLLHTIWPGLIGRQSVSPCDPRYQISMGLLATIMTTISGDGLLQPILYTIPFVTAVESCGIRRAGLIGGGYLLLLGAALLYGRQRALIDLAYPLAGYSSLMLFMATFVTLAASERNARARADSLAEENARLARAASLSATLAERNRIARELHDTIAQGLAATTLRLEAAQQLAERDPALARVQLDHGLNYARQTLRDVRQSVWTLAAPTIAPTDLPQALHELADQLSARTGLQVSYQHQGDVPALDTATATQLLRIVQEALQNIEKHAGAASCRILSSCNSGRLTLTVADDGKGFAPTQQESMPGHGFGLISMRERAQLLGAVLQILSIPSRGTTVTLELSTAAV